MKTRVAAALTLVVSMFAIAALMNEKEIIFPEIAALALGAWVIPQSSWDKKPVNLWVSPSLAAFTGMAIIKFLPFDSLIMIVVALALVILQLHLMKSHVFPALSAAILPIIVHANSWLYPFSVCLFTGIIWLAKRWLDVDNTQIGKEKPVPENRSSFDLKYWGKFYLLVLGVSAFALNFDLPYMIAPPLIVAFIELTQPNSKINRLTFVLLIGVAAFSGVFFFYFITYFLNWPVWISSAVSFAWLLILCRWMKLALPPAAAITLLPTIVSPQNLWSYPFHVILGACIFVVLRTLFFQSGMKQRTRSIAG